MAKITEWLILVFMSTLESKNLFFKDLSLHPIFKKNHIYRPLDTVAYKDPIAYIQDMDYLLISTNNSILNLNIYTLEEIQNLPIYVRPNFDPCILGKVSPKNSCHLFHYWSKIIALSADSGVHQLFVCDSSGKATYHDLKNLSSTNFSESCPKFTDLSLFASDMNFYVGHSKRIRRFQPKFVDSYTSVRKKSIYTIVDPFWIQQNDFMQLVFIFDNDNFVYILFREAAEEEKDHCGGKGVKSRIARVSKDDEGGMANRLEKNWITFVKATIVCYDDNTGNVDSSLNHVEAAFYDNERKFLYATFSSGRSGPLSSAICQYAITDIDLALEGPYLKVNDAKNLNTPIQKQETNCESSKLICQIERAVKYQLKLNRIIPSDKKNLIRQYGEIWTHIQVMTISRSSRQYDIIFVATSKRKIKKFYRKLTDNFLCYSETLSLSEKSDNLSTITDMKIINAKKSPQLYLLVTVSKGVYKIAVEHCQIHLTEYLCDDPFCFWDQTSTLCQSIFQLDAYKLRHLPQLTICTDGNEFFDTMWKQWTSWKIIGSGNDICESRIRMCRDNLCVNTGSFVNNMEVEVKNCSKHNEWTTWSAWSMCSSTCGPGVQTRKRWCVQNAFCLGNSTETQLCHIDNQCQGSNVTYNTWMEWSKCSSDCGEGLRLRSKRCSNKEVAEENSCLLTESSPCNGFNCKELSSYVSMDLKGGSGRNVLWGKCHGNVSTTTLLSATIEYEEDRQNDTTDLVWQCWSDWTNCSEYCSGQRYEDFQRMRTRTCRVTELCLGENHETNTCKEDNCLGAMLMVTNDEKGFQLVYIILVGAASFTITCLIVIAGVCIYFSKHKPLSKMPSLNTDTNTLNRRPLYMRDSYSPIPRSPQRSPGYRMDSYSPDMHPSLNRLARTQPSNPIYMPPPSVPENYPMFSRH